MGHLIKIIIKFFLAEKFFFIPKKTKIMILDNISQEMFKTQFNKFNFSILSIRHEKINIYVLFLLFIKLKKINIINYVIEYIHLSDPKIIITFNHNLLLFYNLKSFFPKKKFIAIQNGQQVKLNFDYLKNKKDIKTDYFLSFGKRISQEYMKHFKWKFIELGSIRNNFIKKKKILKLKKFILFISSGYQSRENLKYHKISQKKITKKKKFFEKEKIILNNLHKYCKKNGLKLEILEKFYHKDNLEYKYYKKILREKKFFYHKKNKKRNLLAYEISDKVLVTFSTLSTLGLELISRGNRVGICNYRQSINKILDIFWPLKIRARGKFWTNRYDYKEIKRILDFSIKCNKKNWDKQSSFVKINLMTFNPQNTKLISLLNKIY